MIKYFISNLLLLLLIFSLNLFSQNSKWNNIIAGGKVINAIAEYDKFLWIACDIGLIKMDKTDGSMKIYDKTYALPGNYINTLAINSNGEVWFGLKGTNGISGFGLVKFDGNNFTIYNSSNSGLPSNFISSLYFDKNDNLWIGSEDSGYLNLVKFDGSNWTIYDSNNSILPSNSAIKSIASDSTQLWIATHSGLFSFDGSNWVQYSLPSVIIEYVYVDKSNTKWIAMYNGIASFNDSEWTYYSGTDSTTPLYYNSINNITKDDNDVLWIGTYKGLVKYDFQNWSIYTPSNSDLPANQIKSLFTDSQNYLWIGSFDWHENGRLTKFDRQSWINFKTWKGNLSSNYIRYLKNGRDSLLIGTHRALNSVTGENWNTFEWIDTLNTFANYSFISSTKDNNENYWFCIRGSWPIGSDPISGVLKYDGLNWMKYDPLNSMLPVCDIEQIDYSQNDGFIWLATSVGAVYFDGNHWHQLDSLFNYSADTLLTSIVTQGNTKWFGSRYFGLLSYENGNWKFYNTNNSGLPDNQISYLYLDDENNLWVCTYNGLAKYDGVNWEIFNTSNSGLPDNHITCFKKNENGYYLIGTANHGFTLYDGAKWDMFNENNSPLLSDEIVDLELDKEGNVWIGCSDEGLSILSKDGLSSINEFKQYSYPKTFILFQNYPNPFNPTTRIRYQVSSIGQTTLKVYDILGNEVATLVNEKKDPGYYEVEFNASSIASGVYIYRLQSGSFTSSKKMIVLK